MSEAELHKKVADYLRLQYPHILFHSDTGSGMKLTPGQARAQARLQGNRRAWPDVFIAQPIAPHHGLFIELKREGTKIYKRNGEMVANEHIQEQAMVLEDLEYMGYQAHFACGFDEAKTIIDGYLAQ